MVNLPSNNFDLTETECKRAFAVGLVVLVQANPNDMGILFLTNKGDRGYVIKKGGALKRYKTNLDRSLAIDIIKGN